MSKQIFVLTALGVVLSIFFATGCKQKKKSTDRTLTVPQATVSVERSEEDSAPKRSMPEFLESNDALKAVSERYYPVLGFKSSEELLKDLKSWVKVISVEEGSSVYRLEVYAPTVPIGAAILRTWIEQLREVEDPATEIDTLNLLIMKNETRQIEINSILRSEFPELVRVEMDQPEVLVDLQLRTELPIYSDNSSLEIKDLGGERESRFDEVKAAAEARNLKQALQFRTSLMTYWENLSGSKDLSGAEDLSELEDLRASIKEAYDENRLDAVAALAAVEKFQQAKLNGIQIKGSLIALRTELNDCVLSWESLDEERAQKLNREQIASMEAGLQEKIAELGPRAPEVVETQLRIKALKGMAEIQSEGLKIPDKAENDAAYPKVQEFLEQEEGKYANRFDAEGFAKARDLLRELISIRSKLENQNEELIELTKAADSVVVPDYYIELLGKLRICAAKRSEVEAYEKLRQQYAFLPEIEFIIRN